MIKKFQHLLNLLTSSQRKKFYLLQVLLVLMSFFEVIGIASIIPFMTLVGDMSVLQQDSVIAKLYHISGFTSEISSVLSSCLMNDFRSTFELRRLGFSSIFLLISSVSSAPAAMPDT